MDAIHQVDIDDFIDVANSLRPDIKKSMCIRMRRIDNSYPSGLFPDNEQEFPDLHIYGNSDLFLYM